jgi:cobalt-zinc-cadmium efflux system membrane fusion protein
MKIRNPASMARLGVLALCGIGLPGAVQAQATAKPPELTLQLSPAQVPAMGLVMAPVRAATAALGPYAATVSLPPARLRRVTAPWPALVAQMQVSEGDSVKAGQVLATLVSPDGLQALNAARAAGSQHMLSQQSLQRDEALYKEGLIPRSRLETSRSQARQAELAVQSQQAATQMPDVRWVNGRLAVLAPIAGVVLDKTVDMGQRVDAGNALMHIGQAGHWWVELRVPVADAARIRNGQVVRLGEQTDACQATVSAVGLGVDAASQTVLVRALVKPSADESACPLRWGQAMAARVQDASAQTVGLPDTAITAWQGGAAVWVQEAQGRFRLQPVQQAQRRGTASTVQGLPTHTRVVVHGTAALKAMLDARP